MNNTMTLEELYNYLIEGTNSIEKKIIILLFENTNQKNKVANFAVENLRKNPNFHINMKRPLLFQTNLIQVNNYRVYLGLLKDEKYLSNIYSNSNIYYYVEK